MHISVQGPQTCLQTTSAGRPPDQEKRTWVGHHSWLLPSGCTHGDFIACLVRIRPRSLTMPYLSPSPAVICPFTRRCLNRISYDRFHPSLSFPGLSPLSNLVYGLGTTHGHNAPSDASSGRFSPSFGSIYGPMVWTAWDIRSRMPSGISFPIHSNSPFQIHFDAQ